MKKLLFLTLSVLAVSVTACSSNDQSKEKQDSIEAAAAADSMLRDATQEADSTVTVDSIVVDTTPVPEQDQN